jgi:hypothetical protein
MGFSKQLIRSGHHLAGSQAEDQPSRWSFDRIVIRQNLQDTLLFLIFSYRSSFQQIQSGCILGHIQGKEVRKLHLQHCIDTHTHNLMHLSEFCGFLPPMFCVYIYGICIHIYIQCIYIYVTWYNQMNSIIHSFNLHECARSPMP